MADIQEYKCPCCGGALNFDSDIQKMKCPFCDTEFEMESLKALDDDLNNQKAESMEWESRPGGEWQNGEADGISVYVCKSCGGEIIGDENTSATSCPYCGNPVVIKGNFSGDMKPDLVIPFKLDKKAAVAELKKHLCGKRLLPKAFKDENHIEEVKGVYVPFWLFNADADADVRYNATKVRSWSDSSYTYTETSYYRAVRSGNISFDWIPVDGSSKMPDAMMESLEPYNNAEAVDFQTAYLAGYLADKYDVSEADNISRANDRVKKSVEKSFASTVTGYTTVANDDTRIRLSNGKAKYALYPVWILLTQWKDQKYTFVMNGQTGKFVGDLPMDKAAYSKWLLLSAAIAGVASYLLMTFINLL